MYPLSTASSHAVFSKQLKPMSFTVSDMLIVSSAEQPLNAFKPNLTKLSGKVTLLRAVQFINAPFPISLTVDANSILLRSGHAANIVTPTLSAPSRTLTVLRRRQLANTDWPMVSIYLRFTSRISAQL